MIAKLPFTSSTEKDIFDLLMSAKQRLTENVLSELFLERGIIYSNQTERLDLCQSISLMPHGHKSILYMIRMRELSHRAEKRAYTVLPVDLTSDEIDKAMNAYKNRPGINDYVTVASRRAKGAVFKVAYNEIDYSKTRLMQSQTKDGDIEIVSENGHTTIRMPSTDKMIDVVDAFREEVEKIKLQPIKAESVELLGLSADQRTDFFINLMRNVQGYKLNTVVSIKVASEIPTDNLSSEIAIAGGKKGDDDLLTKVNSAALSGLNLLQSDEYQTMRKNGFFLTAVVWRAEQTSHPFDMLQFDVSFKDAARGLGFRFNARIARRLKGGSLTDDFIPLEENRQPAVWKIIEAASRSVLSTIRSNADVDGPNT